VQTSNVCTYEQDAEALQLVVMSSGSVGPWRAQL